MQTAVGDLIDARTPRIARLVTDPERQTEQEWAVLVDAELEHHPAAPVRLGQIGLHTTGQAGSVTPIGLAGVEVLASNTIALETRDRLFADLARCRRRVGKVLSDRTRVELHPPAMGAQGSSSVGRSPKCCSNSAAVAGRPAGTGNTDGYPSKALTGSAR